MDTLIHYVTLLKNGEKYHDYCADDAIYFLERAKEAFEAMKTSPEKWYQDSRFSSQVLANCLPFLLLQSQALSNLDPEESSPDTPVSVPLDLNNYEPEF